MSRWSAMLAMLAFVAFSAVASENGEAMSAENEIDRIVELMRIRDGLLIGAEEAIAMPELASAPEDKKACMRRLSVGDIALAPFKNRMRDAFPDADSRRRAIEFFSSEPGRKIIDWMAKTNRQLAEIKADLGSDGYRAFEAYLREGGDKNLSALFQKMDENDDVARAIRRECPRR